MATTAYKNKALPGKGHLCAICALDTRGRTVLVHLTHGVSLWLCPFHASEDFRTRNSGRDFVATLTRIWSSSQVLKGARSKALTAHIERLNAAGRRLARPLPGSYAWKGLRNEVEHRAAAGEPLRSIMADIRSRHAHDFADVPSERTVRRWYRDARWEQDEYRTPLRPGFHARDLARARRAQEIRAPIARMRETHATRLAERSAQAKGRRSEAPAAADAAVAMGPDRGGSRPARASRAASPARAP